MVLLTDDRQALTFSVASPRDFFTLSPNREPVDRLFLSLQVNEKFAIDLVDEEPPIEVHARYVWCDGGHYYFFLSIKLTYESFYSEKQASLLLSLYISCHRHLHCTQIVYLDSASSGTCHLNPDQYCYCLTLIIISMVSAYVSG